MSEQRIFWDYEEHLGTILAKGDDPLGKLAATVDFERFRARIRFGISARR